MSIYEQIPEGEPLTRGRLIAAIEHIKLICEAHGHTDGAKVDLVYDLACGLVAEWENEDQTS